MSQVLRSWKILIFVVWWVSYWLYILSTSIVIPSLMFDNPLSNIKLIFKKWNSMLIKKISEFDFEIETLNTIGKDWSKGLWGMYIVNVGLDFTFI